MAVIAAAADGAQTGPTGTTASAAWPGDIMDDPETDADESFTGMLSVTVSPNGAGDIPFELRASRDATDLNNDGDTTDDGEAAIIQTAMKIDDLGVFPGIRHLGG